MDGFEKNYGDVRIVEAAPLKFAENWDLGMLLLIMQKLISWTGIGFAVPAIWRIPADLQRCMTALHTAICEMKEKAGKWDKFQSELTAAIKKQPPAVFPLIPEPGGKGADKETPLRQRWTQLYDRIRPGGRQTVEERVEELLSAERRLEALKSDPSAASGGGL